MITWLKQHPLVVYFVLANAISWAVAAPLIASAQGWLDAPVPRALHYLTAYGPMLAAIVVTWLTGGAAGLRDLFGRITKWRVGTAWIAIAALSPFAIFAVSAAIARLMGAAWPEIDALGDVNYLPHLGPLGAWVLWLLTSGLGEEVGWRGYALPRLQQNRSSLAATLILGGLWVLWHVPFFFYLETYMKLGFTVFPAFALSVILGAFIYTWLYNGTGGSVLMVILFHAAFNTTTASRAGEGTIAAVASMLVIVWSVVILVGYSRARLARRPEPPADSGLPASPSRGALHLS